ncbi:MAG: methylmalonyl-CoA mutase family protein [SAR324 cluster bacterium]|nr:methylmalonyl-CoA mutase family protein [SAR324 cluster bacterium]
MNTPNNRTTPSNIPIKTHYGADDRPTDGNLAAPGEYPFTRGIYPDMYRGRLWTMRQYAGFGSAEESNRRYRYLMDNGTTGLSVAFDLPTQIGYDSDDPMAEGEVGKTGVAIDSIADMEVLFRDIPLDRVSTSMTINATAFVLLALYVAVGKRQGLAPAVLSGTVQNDILKEYIARGTHIYPAKPSLRLITDIFAYCDRELPKFNTISISGYHIREAGASAVQELAFTLCNAICYTQAALDAGLKIDQFAPRLSFFFNGHSNFFEEVAKFRAARRIWAKIVKERFRAEHPRSMMLRFHTQTGGSTLTAQQVENNVARVAFQALAAVLGGTQSLHTNGMDEALGLPTEHAARVALRTQQIIAQETGVTDTADPLAGSYFVEALTDEFEARVMDYIERVDEMGGSIEAIESGFFQKEIRSTAYETQIAIDRRERIVVGVNDYVQEEAVEPEIFRVDDAIRESQVARLTALKARRDGQAAHEALEEIRRSARGTENMMPAVVEAVERNVTLGEIAHALREEWGTYRE